MNYPSTHESLIERVQNGDEVSWNDFYCRYAPVIRYAGTLYRFNEAECDDLVQGVMLKFFANSKTFIYQEGKVKFRTYFATIVRSQAVDYIRKNAVQRNLEIDLTKMVEPFEEAFLCEWRKAVFEEAKDELRQRVDAKTFQAFEMYGLQNRAAPQVAAVLKMKVDQLYVAKSRCMTILKEIVERHNKADGELHLEL